MSPSPFQVLSNQALAEIQAICPDVDLMSRMATALEPLLAESMHTYRLLQTTEATLRTLVNNFPGGVVSVFDTELRHVLAGGETSDQLGFDPPDMVGKKPSEYRPGDKSDRLEVLIQRTLLGESVRGLEYDGERTTLVISTPIFDEARTVVGTIVVGQDVTDLVLLQEEKFEQERARARLEREVATSRARAAIIEQVLHEIRNPLASLSSSVEMLERYDDRMTPEKRADHLRRIYYEVRALAKTLSQLAQIRD